MALSPAALKIGLSSLGVAGVAATGIIFKDKISEFFGSANYQELISKIGITEENCKDFTNENFISCQIQPNQLVKINFSGKEDDDLTIDPSITKPVNLLIEKTSDKDFENGLKLTFQNDSDIVIKKSSNTLITLKAHTNPTFKVENKENKYFLKALDVQTLGKKVGLGCTEPNASTKECSISGSNKLKIFRNSDNNTNSASFSSSDKSKKITYAIDEKGYNQGFKFTVSADINLENPKTGITKLSQTDMLYEIKLHTLRNGKQEWFLTEVPEKGITNFPDKCKISTDNSCDLTKDEFKKINILSKEDEEWNNDLNISGNDSSGEIISLSWLRKNTNDEYFPLGLEFLAKSKDATKTIKVKKDSSTETDKEITIDRNGVKFLLKTKSNKYYLAQELSEKTKESKVGMTCSVQGDSTTCCNPNTDETISGITKASDGTLKVTKLTTSEGIQKYKVEGSQKNGNYIIVYKDDNWKLEELT